LIEKTDKPCGRQKGGAGCGETREGKKKPGRPKREKKDTPAPRRPPASRRKAPCSSYRSERKPDSGVFLVKEKEKVTNSGRKEIFWGGWLLTHRRLKQGTLVKKKKKRPT